MEWFAIAAALIYAFGTNYRIQCLKDRIAQLEKAAGIVPRPELDPDRPLTAQ